MKLIMRVAIVGACFFAALACFSFGVPAGGGLFILLGVVFEGMMWHQLFRPKKNRHKTP